MCRVASWVDLSSVVKNGRKIYFITNNELLTLRGRKLKKYLGNRFAEDIQGHGACRYYYPELKEGVGRDKECTNFSTPDNFPPEIVAAIMAGQMTQIGFSLDLLNPLGKKKYNAIVDPVKKEVSIRTTFAWEKCNAIIYPVWKEYDAIVNPVEKKFNAIIASARREYNAIVGSARKKRATIVGLEREKLTAIITSALEKFIDIRDSARKKRDAIINSERIKLNAIKDSAWEERDAITCLAWGEYRKIAILEFWKIFTKKEYRNPNWC